jgi:hypothetical protein
MNVNSFRDIYSSCQEIAASAASDENIGANVGDFRLT